MKKWSIIILFSLCLMVGLLWGGYQWLDDQKLTDVIPRVSGNDEDDGKQALEDKRDEIKGTITEEDLTTFKEQGLNPFGEKTKKNGLTDTMYQEYIHGMSHQKVRADKKWGFYEIHPDRIKWLLDGLDEVDVEHESVYRDILVKWQKGDFISADADHNAIWNLQGGTVGKATGILSQEEEQRYVEENAN